MCDILPWCASQKGNAFFCIPSSFKAYNLSSGQGLSTSRHAPDRTPVSCFLEAPVPCSPLLVYIVYILRQKTAKLQSDTSFIRQYFQHIKQPSTVRSVPDAGIKFKRHRYKFSPVSIDILNDGAIACGHPWHALPSPHQRGRALKGLTDSFRATKQRFPSQQEVLRFTVGNPSPFFSQFLRGSPTCPRAIKKNFR